MPSRGFNIGVTVAMLLFLVTSTPPDWMLGPAAVTGLALVGFGAAWIVMLCTHLTGERRGRLWGFLVVPVVAVLGTVLAITDVPTRIGFELSRSTFERRLDEVLREPTPATGDGPVEWSTRARTERVGLFEVDTIVRHGTVVEFETGGFFFSAAGFVYSPDEVPYADHPYSKDVIGLGGDWYAYSVAWD
jgi:hypothetical protein